MRIQVGEIFMDKVTQQKITYPNKTRKYLLPCLKHYGEAFTTKLNNVFKIAVGIGDVITDNCGFTHEKHIFILIDTTISTKFFIKFIEWIRDQSMYEDDYVFNNIQKSTYHMVVIKFPEVYYEAFNNFHGGKYSKMFNEKTIEEFFHNYPEVKKVFIKDHDYRIQFVEELNKEFNLKGKMRINPKEWEGDVDLPPKKEDEYFNHHIKNNK